MNDQDGVIVKSARGDILAENQVADMDLFESALPQVLKTID